MAIDNGILKTVLGFLGVKDIRAATDSPQAKVNITFTRYGKLQEINLTLEQVIDALQDTESSSAEAPGSRDQHQTGG